MFRLFRKTQNRAYCTKAVSKTSYSHTVLLPKTKFPLRLEENKIVERDKNVHKIMRDETLKKQGQQLVLNLCEYFELEKKNAGPIENVLSVQELAAFDELYEWQKVHLREPEYTLHDGPPYANGKPHMGHAINKVLKDIILRYKILNKTKVNYVPGWDCHGLPIEMKALSNSSNLESVQIRSKAKNFAQKTIKQQMNTFRSWGVTGDWQNRYETSSVSYVENQLRIFLKLYEKGYIYRDVKPIYWSPSSRTALAEAELEYNEKHQSPSAYVRIMVKDIPELPNLSDKRVYAIIWTTTPWTLPTNQAICYNNSLAYVIIKKHDLNDKDLYIIAADLYENFCKETKCEYQLLGVHSGEMLRNATYIHPIYPEQKCSFFHSSHATNTKGTGLVHTAPAHGPDDFLVAIKHKMSIVDLVNENGQYTDEAGEIFANKFVLTEGNHTVLKFLGENLLHQSVIKHSYPYDWRTKQPVIIKASKQWFINTEKLKQKAVKILGDVEIIPTEKSDVFRNVLVSQLEQRPYWCISRQRQWGVPIPVFYGADTKEVLINEKTVYHLCDLLVKNGTDFWWTLPLNDLLPVEYSSRYTEYIKGKDILDIWFDSGISWSYALKDNKIADLYLEGVDQFRGWFQSSLLTSVALRNQAPYKAIFVHGYAVDQAGQKMSKSLGNVVDPVDVTCGKNGQKAYGVDVLRWWVGCHANQVSLASVSKNILDQSKEEVQKIRSVLRFALGALNDYQHNEEDYKHTCLIDQYVLHLLYQLFKKSKIHIDTYSFHKINTALIPFLTNQISALYFTSIKDRLYCEPANSASRRSAQYTLLQLYYTISSIIGGILPHLAEECYLYLPQKTGETFFTSQLLEPTKEWENFNVEKSMEHILEIRKEVNKINGNGTLDVEVKLKLGNEFKPLLTHLNSQQLSSQVRDILQVSKVDMLQDYTLECKFKLFTSKSNKHSCPRCRLVHSDVENNVCGRCQRVLDNLNINKEAVAE